MGEREEGREGVRERGRSEIHSLEKKGLSLQEEHTNRSNVPVCTEHRFLY